MDKSFKKNVAILLSGGIIAQLIPLLSNLLLSRLYTPNNFGVYAAFFGIASVLGSVSILRYDVTILLPKSNIEASYLRVISLFSLTLFLLLTITVLFVFEDILTETINFPKQDGTLIILISLGIFCIGLNLINQNTLTRSASFHILTYGKIIYSVTTAITAISFGYYRFGDLGLILGNVAGLFAMCIYYQLHVEKKIFFNQIRKYYLVKLARKYNEFPKFSLISTLLNGISNLGLPTVITFFFSPTVAGLYFFTFKIVKTPIDLILQSIGQVFKAEANKLFYSNKKELAVLIKTIQLRIFLIITPILLFLSFFGIQVFRLVFGNEWEAAGSLIKFISFFVLCNSIYNPVSAIGDLLGEQRVLLVFNCLLVLIQLGVFFYFKSIFTFNQNIFIVSIINGLLFLILDQYMKFKLKKYDFNHV